jgi:hypothetical protein
MSCRWPPRSSPRRRQGRDAAKMDGTSAASRARSSTSTLPSRQGHRPVSPLSLTRVNSTNVLYEGLRIGGIGCRINSKVKSVKQDVYQK